MPVYSLGTYQFESYFLVDGVRVSWQLPLPPSVERSVRESTNPSVNFDRDLCGRYNGVFVKYEDGPPITAAIYLAIIAFLIDEDTSRRIRRELMYDRYGTSAAEREPVPPLVLPRPLYYNYAGGGGWKTPDWYTS